MQRHRKTRPSRPGFSLLELQVALILLGIALAGIGPLTVMRARHLKRIEDRFRPDTRYLLVPDRSEWARKLGSTGTLEPADSANPSTPTESTSKPVAATGAPILIDNRDSGYAEQDIGRIDWFTRTTWDAYGSSYRLQNGGGFGDAATWTFSGLRPGEYDVYVTYPIHRAHASDTPFTILDGTRALQTIEVNQQSRPSGLVYGGSSWDNLGRFRITGDTLIVRITDNVSSRKYVAADAVHIVPVVGGIELLSVTRTITGEEITARVSIMGAGR